MKEKLIRSNIPNIVMLDRKEKINAKTLSILKDREEIIQLLKEKILEEATEVINEIGKNKISLIEELGDLITVIDTICAVENIDKPYLNSLMNSKKAIKGDFSFKIDGTLYLLKWDGTILEV